MQLVHDFIVNAEWDFSSLQIVSHVSRLAVTVEKPLINTKIRLKWRILLCFTRFTDIFYSFDCTTVLFATIAFCVFLTAIASKPRGQTIVLPVMPRSGCVCRVFSLLSWLLSGETSLSNHPIVGVCEFFHYFHQMPKSDFCAL